MLILGYFEVTAGVSAIVMVFSDTFKNIKKKTKIQAMIYKT
jgi:hypothetical protein